VLKGIIILSYILPLISVSNMPYKGNSTAFNLSLLVFERWSVSFDLLEILYILCNDLDVTFVFYKNVTET